MRNLMWAFCAVSAAVSVPALEIGQKAPYVTFKDIRYLPRTLADLGEWKACVITFVTKDCPVAQRYLPHLEKLYREYGSRGARFLAVNVGPEDSVRDTAYEAIEHGLSFPFVKDFTGEMARALGVDRTAEVLVLDAAGILRYRGRVNDQYRLSGVRPKPSREDLDIALQQVMAGKAVTVPETPVDGCRITFPEPVPADNTLTWAGDVAPILYKHCIECHRPNGGAPFALLEYKSAHRFAKMIAEVVSEERMPPWYAHEKFGEWRNERRLTAREKETLIAWAKGTRKRGALSQAPAAPVFPTSVWANGEPDLILRAEKPEVLPANGYIPYRYVRLPYRFEKDTYVRGIEIQPTNEKVVHHANLIYTVEGKPGFSFLSGKVPGSADALLSPGEAMLIPEGASLIFQIHYVTTGKVEEDRIGVGFIYAEGKVEKLVYNQFIEDKSFVIPVGADAYETSASWTVPENVTARALFSHMHLRGKDMTFTAAYPGGDRETLLVVPNYSFDWQLAYEFNPGSRRFYKGTELKITAHFDNSAFNPYNPDPSTEVRYGPQTIHEMCIGVLYYTKDDETLEYVVDPASGVLFEAGKQVAEG